MLKKEGRRCLIQTEIPPALSGPMRAAGGLVVTVPLKCRARTRRLLVVDRHEAERVGSMARPIVIRPEADVADIVLALVVVAERIAAGFRGRLVEPASRQNAAHRLDPHGRRAHALVLHRRSTLKAGVAPMIDVALAGDVVGGDAIVRQCR